MLDEVSADVQAKVLERIPVGRLAEVDDNSGIVRFVASDDADVTRRVLAVTGGMER